MSEEAVAGVVGSAVSAAAAVVAVIAPRHRESAEAAGARAVRWRVARKDAQDREPREPPAPRAADREADRPKAVAVREASPATKVPVPLNRSHVTADRRIVLAATLLLTLAGCTSERPRVNFLFILADDLGVMDVGAFNPGTFYETPHLDSLAASGMRFTHAYAASPVCSPTRASILTGKHPARLHTTDWFGAPQPDTTSARWLDKPLLPAAYVDALPHDETTLAEVFREAGYRTFFAGKWHLGPVGSYPEDHGFEINKGGFERGGPSGGNHYFSPYGNPRLTDGPPGEHLPARLARETSEFILRTAEADEPFLAYLSFYSVHTPLMARADLEEKYDVRRRDAPEDSWGQEGDRRVRRVQNHAVYAGMVEAMDQAVGAVLTALETAGIEKNTVVIFMSDNGGLSTSEGHPTSNLPYRAGKGWLYEGGVREPMMVRWPQVTAPGSIAETPTISMDFYPTMLEMAGLPLRPSQHADGRSLVSVLRGSESDRGALFWHYPHYGNQGGSPASSMRRGNFKLIRFFEDDHVELYDLAADPGESHDLALSDPDRAAAMNDALTRWHQDVQAGFPTINPSPRPVLGGR